MNIILAFCMSYSLTLSHVHRPEFSKVGKQSVGAGDMFQQLTFAALIEDPALILSTYMVVNPQPSVPVPRESNTLF